MDKNKEELEKVVAGLDRTEFNSDRSGLSDNGVTFYKSIQYMSQLGLRRLKYTDYAFKKEEKDHKIFITISRKKPWFWGLFR